MQDERAVFRIQLHQILTHRLDLEELRNLCFYVGVEYDDLRGEGRSSKARELIKHLDNRGQLGALVKAGEQLRSDIPWPVVSAGLEEPASASPISPSEESAGSAATVSGSGAIAQGPGAVAAGEGGVAVGGDVHGGIHIGDRRKDEAKQDEDER
jgi:hypothetical protein